VVGGNWQSSSKSSWLTRAALTLRSSKIATIRNLEVKADDVGIVLHGRVHLYYYKQLAQELIRSELADIPIFNEIEVVEPH